MKRKLLIALAIILALAGFWILREELSYRRATYKGRHAGEWAAEFYPNFDPRSTNEATIALRTMGSNAVPMLLALLNAHEPIYEKTFLQNAKRLPRGARSYLFQKIKPGQTAGLRIGAARALGVIGPEAAEAVPDLIVALTDPEPGIRWAAARALSGMGSNAIVFLAEAADSTNSDTRHSAIYALGEAGTNAIGAVVPLIRCTRDTNESIRASAFYSLNRIGRTAMPVTVDMAATNADLDLKGAAFRSLVVMVPGPSRVPYSILGSSTNNPTIRRMAIWSLGRSQITNENAMTLYNSALNDEDESVRTMAQGELARIRPANTN